MQSPFDRRLEVEGHHIRFTSTLDAETLRFENEFLGVEGNVEFNRLNLIHRHVYLKASRREFFLLQMRSPQGVPVCQAAVFIYRPSRLRKFSKALVPRLSAFVDQQSEMFALKMLRKLCVELGGVTELRVQPERLEACELENFSNVARHADFTCAQPLFYTHTLKYDLKAPDELLREMSAKLRSKLRPPKNGFQLKVLTEERSIEVCRQALSESFSRTRGVANDFDFEGAFDVARQAPDKMRVVGIVHENSPSDVLAFSVAAVSGEYAEFLVAGSKADPDLRKIPFNYLIFWELIQWAQIQGALWIDMGGITPGNDGDPLAGISEFKRHFTKNEIEICREFTTILRPVRAWLFNRAQAARQLIAGQSLS